MADVKKPSAWSTARSRVRWWMVAPGVAAGILTTFLNLHEGPTLPSCDSQAARDVLTGVVKDKIKMTATFGDFVDVSESATKNACRVPITTADGTALVATYSFSLEGGKVMIQYDLEAASAPSSEATPSNDKL